MAKILLVNECHTHLSHIMHHTVHVQLSGSQHDVLTGLFNTCRQKRIGFVHLEKMEHLKVID